MTATEELLLVEQAWDAAMMNNDVEEIGRFMSDDWVIIGTEGGITTKAEFLDFIGSGVVQHSRMEADETQVKVYGDTAIIITRGTSAGLYNKQYFELYEWATSFFIKQNSQWICTLTMVTPAKAPE
ncbi:MAG: nuclear transport factor 2 family protein [Agriterribacter sp.]